MQNAMWGHLAGPASGYYVQRAANRIPSRLPELTAATAVKQVTPRFANAKFAQYLVSLEPGGGSAGSVASGFEHFLYVLSGSIETTGDEGSERLAPGDAVYVSDEQRWDFREGAGEPAEMLWLKRRYEPVEGVPRPARMLVSRAAGRHVRKSRFPGLTVEDLMPVGDLSYDFTMTILGFEPGADFPGQEVHEEEHAHVQLSGRGISTLGPHSSETLVEGDFLYMGPFCPHGYASAPDSASSFLLYKDANRDGF